MADSDRQHVATERQRRRFADRGEVAHSRDLAAACVYAMGIATLTHYGDTMSRSLAQLIATVYGRLDHPAGSALLVLMLQTFAQVAGPLMLACALSGVAAGVLQRGGQINFTPVTFDLMRLAPGERLLNIFGSKKALASIVHATLKVVVLGAVCISALRDRMPILLQRNSSSLWQVLRQVGELSSALAWRGAVGFLVVGGIDFLWQRWQMEQRMRMTHQEMRDEAKEDSGDPFVRAKRRKRQNQLAKQRSLREVPRADVVLVNPTHFAVALSYQAETMQAPRLVAKGADAFAERIRSVARKHGIPVISQPPLTRLLFARVQVGKSVPSDLYQAVAVVLAQVYRIRARRVG